MTHDGLGKYLSQVIEKAPGTTADIVGIPIYQRARISVYSRDFVNVVPGGADFGEGFDNTWWEMGMSLETPLEDIVAVLQADLETLQSQVSTLTTIAYIAVIIAVILPVVAIYYTMKKKPSQ